MTSQQRGLFACPALLALSAAILGALGSGPAARADSVTLTGTKQQTFSGFGGSIAFIEGIENGAASDSVKQQFLDDLYQNLNLAYLRFDLSPSFSPSDGVYDINTALNSNVTGELNAARARKSDLKFVFTAWSPPAYMKANGRTIGANGNGDRDNYLLTSYQTKYGTYLAEFTRQFQSKLGYPLDYLSPQNEPNVNVPYDSCVYINNNNPNYSGSGWPNEYTDMAHQAAAQVRALGGPTRIFGPEWGAADGNFVNPLLDSIGSDIDIAAVHSYVYAIEDSSNPNGVIDLSKLRGKPFWQTEVSFQGYSQHDDNDYNQAASDGQALIQSWGGTYTPEIGDLNYGPKLGAMAADRFAQDFNNGHVNAWFWWWLAGSQGTQEGEKLVLTGPGRPWSSYRLTKKYWAVRALSQAFLPGATGQTATSDTGDLTAAGCKNADGTYALVVTNRSNTGHSSVAVSLSDLSGSGAQSFTRTVIDPGSDNGTSTVTFTNGQYTENVPANTVIVYKQQTAATGGGGGSAAPIGQTISLKANSNGYYVTAALNDSNDYLRSSWATSVGGWEQFQVVDAGGGWIALKAFNGDYVSCNPNNNSRLQAQWATGIGDWEKFQWVDAGNGFIALKANATGKYVTANPYDTDVPGGLTADHADTIQDWEKFLGPAPSSLSAN